MYKLYNGKANLNTLHRQRRLDTDTPFPLVIYVYVKRHLSARISYCKAVPGERDSQNPGSLVMTWPDSSGILFPKLCGPSWTVRKDPNPWPVPCCRHEIRQIYFEIGDRGDALEIMWVVHIHCSLNHPSKVLCARARRVVYQKCPQGILHYR